MLSLLILELSIFYYIIAIYISSYYTPKMPEEEECWKNATEEEEELERIRMATKNRTIKFHQKKIK